MADFEDLGGNEDWDEEFAKDLVGKTLLVGLTFLAADENLLQREQVFGTVESCDPESGISVRVRASGEIYVVAPILAAIEHGDPGVYKLANTDETVEDPDFIAMLTIIQPRRD